MRTIEINCLPIWGRFTQRVKHLKFSAITVSCIVMGLLTNSVSIAQTTTPSQCVQGCTSNDVQIKVAYLSNAAGVKLGTGFVCPQTGVASVYLTLELTTNTPRIGVSIYTNIKSLDATGNPTGSPIASPNECFGITLNQPTNKVTFQQPFNWSCGTGIALTDVFIGWGTGNKNFCTGPSFQCPATPSKCYLLPGDKFIAIETPGSQNNSDTKCSDQPGGSTATFNLNNIQVTTSSNVTITWWENYTAPSTFSSQITTPGGYSTISRTVYAKITSNSDANVFSVSTVTLTVNQKPNLQITNPGAVCSPSTIDISDPSIRAGSTLPTGTTLTYYLNNNGAPGSPITNTVVGNGTYWIKATTNTTPACSDQKQVVVTVNPKPTGLEADVTQPNCTRALGTITVTSDKTGLTFSLNSTNPTDFTNTSGEFPNLSQGTYVVRAKNSSGCISDGLSKNVNAQPSAPATPSFTVTQPALCGPATGSISICNSLAGLTYIVGTTEITPETNGEAVNFTGLAPNSNPTVKVRNSAGCESTPVSCNAAVASCTPQGNTVSANQKNYDVEIDLAPLTKVIAAPNPFNDRVRFSLKSAVSGQGSLELYNTLGQKVKSVFQGYVTAGQVQTIEYSVPGVQRANLIYVFTVGKEKTTGKLINLRK